MAADAISAARPGDRRENIESYIKRLETLEALCNGFEGVESSYAVPVSYTHLDVYKRQVHCNSIHSFGSTP